MKIAVTGNIGCGKSTVVQRLAQLLPGYALFDVDAAIRDIYENPYFQDELIREFGTAKRADISNLVFSDPDKRAKLEALSHRYWKPPFYKALEQKNVLFEYPLLFEIGIGIRSFDLIVTVTCDPDTQVERVKMRNGFSSDKIRQIQEAQHSNLLKETLADVVLDTSVQAAVLEEKITELAQYIRILDLKERFLANVGMDEAAWEALQAAYSEPQRHYHTLAHLEAMFTEFDRVKHLLHQPRIVETAIWFHDYVYEVNAAAYPLNEANSAKALMALNRNRSLTIIDQELGRAAEMILATKGHAPKAAYFQGHPEALADCKIFLDIDLSILAQGQKALFAYDQAIRQEFGHFSEADFAKGRVEALRSFLDRDRIFMSEAFTDRETQARYNLQLLVDYWTQKQG